MMYFDEKNERVVPCMYGNNLRMNLNYKGNGGCSACKSHANPENLCKYGNCDPSYPYLTNLDGTDKNTVKDYRILENKQDPGDVSLVQNVNTKHIRLESNTMKPLLVAISTQGRQFECTDTFTTLGLKPQFLLKGGQVRDLSVNMPGERMQYIFLFNPENGGIVNTPHPIRAHINQFVVNEGNHSSQSVLNNICNNNTQHKGVPFNTWPPKMSAPEYSKKGSLFWIFDMKSVGFKN